jgi:hypothetical protein
MKTKSNIKILLNSLKESDRKSWLKGQISRVLNVDSSLKIRVGLNSELRNPCILLEVSNLDIFPYSRDIRTEAFRIDFIKNSQISTNFWLRLELVDQTFFELFIVLCEDIISEVIKSQTEKEAVLRLKNRIVKWQKMFAQSKRGLMSLNQQTGLFGELFWMRELLDTLPPQSVINAWSGGQGEQDFVFKGLAIEIKTTLKKSNSNFVTINGENQLDNTLLDSLYIAIIKLRKEADYELTLSNLVSQIRILIQNDYDLLNNFISKLFDYGYSEEHLDEYSKFGYQIRDRAVYKVNDSFPKITNSQLPVEIEKVEYNLDLAACQKYMTTKEIIHKQILETC